MAASPKSSVTDNFRKQLEALADYAQAQADLLLEDDKPNRWYRPEGFTGSLKDLEGLHVPFAREEHERQFESAVTDPDNPGTVGDLAIAQLQGDALAAMERAFRARHMSSARCRIHAAARMRGHGHEHGVIRGGLLGYLVNLDRHNKS